MLKHINSNITHSVLQHIPIKHTSNFDYYTREPQNGTDRTEHFHKTPSQHFGNRERNTKKTKTFLYNLFVDSSIWQRLR